MYLKHLGVAVCGYVLATQILRWGLLILRGSECQRCPRFMTPSGHSDTGHVWTWAASFCQSTTMSPSMESQEQERGYLGPCGQRMSSLGLLCGTLMAGRVGRGPGGRRGPVPECPTICLISCGCWEESRRTRTRRRAAIHLPEAQGHGFMLHHPILQIRYLPGQPGWVLVREIIALGVTESVRA